MDALARRRKAVARLDLRAKRQSSLRLPIPSLADEYPAQQVDKLIAEDYNEVTAVANNLQHWPPEYRAMWYNYLHVKSSETLLPMRDYREEDADSYSSYPDLRLLAAKLLKDTEHDAFRDADVVVIITDSEPLSSYGHWKHTARILSDRMTWTHMEKWTMLFVPLDEDSGLSGVHYTWGATFVVEMLIAIDPSKHYIMMDHDAAPTTLFEVHDILKYCQTQAMIRPWTPKSMDEDLSDVGIIVISEYMSPVNAGLVIFPAHWDASLTSEERTIAAVVQAVKDRRAAVLHSKSLFAFAETSFTRPILPKQDFSAEQFEEAWTQETLHRPFIGTPFHHVQAHSSGDFAAIWALFGLVFNWLGFPKKNNLYKNRSEYSKMGTLRKLSENTQRISPGIEAWAGIFFEQGVLSILNASQSPGAQYMLLSGGIGFMHKYLPAHCVFSDEESIGYDSTDRHFPPVFLHCYGNAKPVLARLDSMRKWYTMEQAMFDPTYAPAYMTWDEHRMANVMLGPGLQMQINAQYCTRPTAATVFVRGWQKCSVDSIHPSIKGQLDKVRAHINLFPPIMLRGTLPELLLPPPLTPLPV